MKKTKSFTMIEVLITALLISIGLLTIFEVMNYAKKINQRVAETTIANQLATEGTEIIYQIRNTNFIKYENDKQKYLETCDTGYDECITNFKNTHDLNKCRLALNYEDCMSGGSEISLGTGCYYITNIEGENILNVYTKTVDTTPTEMIAPIFTNINDGSRRDDGRNGRNDRIELNRQQRDEGEINSDCRTDEFINEFAICLNSGTWIPCTGGHDEGHDESKYGKYFRSIKGQGTFDMSSDATGGSILGSNELKGKQAQEYRFCSYVSRRSMDTGSIEICSTMTNFID